MEEDFVVQRVVLECSSEEVELSVVLKLKVFDKV